MSRLKRISGRIATLSKSVVKKLAEKYHLSEYTVGDINHLVGHVPHVWNAYQKLVLKNKG